MRNQLREKKNNVNTRLYHTGPLLSMADIFLYDTKIHWNYTLTSLPEQISGQWTLQPKYILELNIIMFRKKLYFGCLNDTSGDVHCRELIYFLTSYISNLARVYYSQAGPKSVLFPLGNKFTILTQLWRHLAVTVTQYYMAHLP